MSYVHSNPAWIALKKRIDQGELIILDGGVGTEIEKLGGKMNDEGWSCIAHMHRPDLVQAVHERYLQAGSVINTINTFATNRNVLRVLDPPRDQDTLQAIAEAIRICSAAKKTHEDKNPTAPHTFIAGSISTYPPAMAKGTSGTQGTWPEERDEYAAYVEAATAITLSGVVDFIFLEMMKDMIHAPLAIQAYTTITCRCNYVIMRTHALP